MTELITARADAATSTLQRYVLETRPAAPTPAASSMPALPPSTAVITTSDRLAAGLAHDTELTICTCGGGNGDPAVLHPDNVTPATFRSMVADRELAHVRVILDLDDQATPWPSPPTQAIRAAYELTFLAAQHLRDRISDGGSVALLALDSLRAGRPHPGTALFTGMLKSMAWEFGTDRTYGVITDHPRLHDALNTLEYESSQLRGVPYAIYRHGRRHIPVAVHRPLPSPEGPSLGAEPVIVSDAARGLTPVLLTALARPVRPRLWLLGSSRLDDLPAWVLDCSDEEFRACRPGYISERHHQEPGVSMAAVSAEFDNLANARQSVYTIAELRRTFSDDRVTYLPCDITDAHAVNAVADRILSEGQRIDLLVHAATAHGARSLARKSLPIFRRTTAVKVDGYHNLKAALDRHVLTWCNFGSVAGALGLPGDPEYCAGNDYLGSAAAYEQSGRNRDEFTIHWTWWKQAGAGIARGLRGAHMQRSGWLGGTTNEEGVDFFLTELAQPHHSAQTMQIGPTEHDTYTQHTPGTLDPPPAPANDSSRFYLDHRHSENPKIWSRTLDPDRDANLFDHCVNGRPTLPGSHMLEIAAEAAAQHYPGLHPLRFTDVHFHAFLRLNPQSPITFRIHIDPVEAPGAAPEAAVRIVSDVIHPTGRILRRDKLHAELTVHMGPADHRPEPPHQPLEPPEGHTPIPDPYLQPDVPMLLRGVYDSTYDNHVGPTGSSSMLDLQPTTTDHTFTQFNIPCIAIDGLTRAVVADTSGEYPQWGVVVPLGYKQANLYTSGNDTDLDHRFGAQLHALRDSIDAERRLFRIVAPTGEVQIELVNPQLRVMAWFKSRDK